MKKGTDLSPIYRHRSDFTIIGMTGRTGSGCSKIAMQLAKGYGDGADYPDPEDCNIEPGNNSYRKYNIIRKFAMENFRGYNLIRYKDVLTLFLLKYDYAEFIQFLNSPTLANAFARSGLEVKSNFTREIKSLDKLAETFEKFRISLSYIDLSDRNENKGFNELYNLFFESEFQNFSTEFHKILEKGSLMKRNKLLQVIANNLRCSGDPYTITTRDPNNLFTVVELINDIIKSYRKTKGHPTQFVIDSMRNPLEIMFFKQRFSAFYLMAVNRKDEDRKEKLKSKYGESFNDLEKFLEEEYRGGKGGEFYKPYVRECIEKADIHITYRSKERAAAKNEKVKERKDNTSPFFSWEMQLLKYISLIAHPGIITPSPEERCMQLAYTAKYNSGCISRQVGAAITDNNYSIKAIGWNNTPEGQVPCLLRNAEVLIDAPLEERQLKDEEQSDELKTFTPYEKEDNDFREVLLTNFKEPIKQNRQELNGRNVCFCFKTLKNACSEGKNQIHTRSLHAEESAFLQITKYGGEGIAGGKLFTTASPCELCSKKAYQLGIAVIYYIDPYPGISQKQILETGAKPPELRLFNGAIGAAYHWLYEPFMAYKDELSLILGQDIKDFATGLERQLEKSKKEIEAKDKKIQELELLLSPKPEK